MYMIGQVVVDIARLGDSSDSLIECAIEGCRVSSGLLCIGGRGEVGERTLSSGARPATFIGDCAIHTTTVCFFEFTIGAADAAIHCTASCCEGTASMGGERPRLFVLNTKARAIIAIAGAILINALLTLKENEVIGVSYDRRSLCSSFTG
jgi:hypothetical protein